MQRAYNFSAGPAMLPDSVLNKIKDDMLDWRETGVSVTEIGHRTKIFQNFLMELQAKLHKALNIPHNYKILFLHGGAQGQFSAIPMNLAKYNQNVDYIVTGIWSERAKDNAAKYTIPNLVTRRDGFSIPKPDTWNLNPDAAYVYYCNNETIDGVSFNYIPQVGPVPLVADMTSSLATEVYDVSKYGLILAAAQKNLGIAGVTLVIIREDLLEQSLPIVPNIWHYKILSECNSCVNTIPVFPIYVMDLMLDWINEQGGVKQLELINQRKANKLYNFIDNSGYYVNKVAAEDRSKLNIPFMLPNDNEKLLNQFLQEADEAGLKYLNGHILVGGARASLYNAMPEAGVDALVSFMQDFKQRYG